MISFSICKSNEILQYFLSNLKKFVTLLMLTTCMVSCCYSRETEYPTHIILYSSIQLHWCTAVFLSQLPETNLMITL